MYDVFLSFRGDTRYGFTKHLHDALVKNQVKAFMDVVDVDKGEEINDALLCAIEKSKIAIIVFSKDFASSTWCLAEVAKIIDCKDCSGMKVIPVFYNIDPTVVRNQIGPYGEAIAAHLRKSQNEVEKVNRWKLALSRAASIAGWDTKNVYEADLIKSIVEDVSNKLKGPRLKESRSTAQTSTSRSHVFDDCVQSEIEVNDAEDIMPLHSFELAAALGRYASANADSSSTVANSRKRSYENIANSKWNDVVAKAAAGEVVELEPWLQDLVAKSLANFKSLYKDESEMMQFVTQEKEKLEINLSAIKAVLEDAEQKQLEGTSSALDDWLKKLENAVYVLEDILDECFTEAMRDKYEGDRSCSFLSFLHPDRIMFRHNISARMKAIRGKLDTIFQEKEYFQLVSSAHHFSTPDLGQSSANVTHNIHKERLTSPLITEDFICGREREKEDLVRLLLEDGTQNGENLSVHSIVAMGGLGKTTLAKLVYNDKRVQDHFQLKIWLCVSENFELKRLIKGMMKSSHNDDDDLDSLQIKLQAMLAGKKYLLVLDDVWNENRDKWIHLRSLLLCGLKGSSIIVTTRQLKIAMIMETPPANPYSLKPLSDDDCWKIFRKRAFGLLVAKETENLILIGNEIVKKCKGVPLVAKVLGGLLSFRSDEEYWVRVRDSELWNISEGKDPIFGPLKLSYLNLPLQYRRCFCYCAVFPKDYEIEKEDIIQLWMANGFIHSKGTVDMEDIGNDIVKELEWRSLIEVVEKDENGVIERFKIHDLVHDLAHFVTGDDICVADETSSKDLQTRILHVSIFKKLEDSRANMLALHVKCMRSYINHSRSPAWIGDSLSEYTSLRVLDFSRADINEFWSSNGPSGFLKHLRYLNLSYTEIEELPKFISSLWNLQTLKLEWCYSLKALPEGLGRLKNLRHIHNEGCSRLSSISRSIGLLTSLRTLREVIVNSSFQLSSLGSLKCIRGKMKIRHLERVREVRDAQEANLMEKCDLTQLALEWEGNNDKDEQLQVQILEALRPSPKLKYLKLKGYEGAVFPQWMMKDISSFTYLRSLTIYFCKNCKQLPPLWKLRSLKILSLLHLYSLRCLVEDKRDSDGEVMCVGFPSLEKLSLENLPNFRFFDALPDFHNLMFLRTLHISFCENLKSLPEGLKYLSSLEDLQVEHCDQLVDMSNIIYLLPSLQMLSIFDTPITNLGCSTTGLTCLQQDIPHCSPVLRYLYLYGCWNLEALPDWLGDAMFLETIIIFRCWKLECIPNSFQGLTNLKHLRIGRCGELSRRCRKETGEDWYKIKHVPSIELDGDYDDYDYDDCFGKILREESYFDVSSN